MLSPLSSKQSRREPYGPKLRTPPSSRPSYSRAFNPRLRMAWIPAAVECQF
jgi:hypothetical protein